MADRGQLPQTHRPQTKQPTATSLLHTHDPKPLDDSHHGRITPRLTTEQAPTTNATGTTGTISTRALSIRALIAGVLNGHQQASQQPLHPHQPHPTRTTSRDTRKHTTFEHTYSITPPPPTAQRTSPQKPPR